MDLPTPDQMIEQIRALPAAAPLLAALDERPGIYLVGGTVRDLLLHREPLDVDVVVEGDAAALASELGGEARLHGRFGTGTVQLDGRTYDLAGARRERYSHPGALPEVAPAGLEEDLRRRDFTINAIAVALTGPQAGCLIAAPHALEDLEARRLRVLHANSFIDDPTRLLRLARYAARLRFATAPGTDRLARAAVAQGALATVSGPRIGAELRLAAAEPEPDRALSALAEWELDRAIHPALRLEDPALLGRALALLPAKARRDRLALAAAARRIPAAELQALLERLGFTAEDQAVIVAAATRAPEIAKRLAAADRPSAIAAAVTGASAETVALAGALGPREAAAQWLAQLRHVTLQITGADLLAAGIPAGPDVGRGLRAALAARLDGQARHRAAELEVALAAARAGDGAATRADRDGPEREAP